MKTPETGDPEVRVRIPLRGTTEAKVTMRNGVAVIRFGHFLQSNIAIELVDSRAAHKLWSAVQEAEALLHDVERSKTAERRTRASQTKPAKRKASK